jgi:hypothetical protein
LIELFLMGWGFRAGLWGLFALCLIASGLLLLPACGLEVPLHISYAQRLRSKFCPVPIDRTAYLRASEERKAKLERIHRAEIAIARTARCATPGTGTPPRTQPGRT